jgi:hypothetical protein
MEHLWPIPHLLFWSNIVAVIIAWLWFVQRWKRWIVPWYGKEGSLRETFLVLVLFIVTLVFLGVFYGLARTLWLSGR